MILLLDLIFSCAVFFGLCLGTGWLVTRRLPLPPVEKLLASLVCSLLAVFALAWLIYILSIPRTALLVIPFVAAVSLLTHFRAFAALCSEPSVRSLATGQLIASTWGAALLALVRDYSGGDRWVGDWFGHWQRAQFFLYRWPRDILFNGFDPLPSRPPLANVVYGALLEVTRIDFAHYQLFSTLFATLCFYPAALIALRVARAGGIGHTRVLYVLLILFMLNPSFVQNATYAWTKLPAAFFVLGGIYFLLRAQDADSSSALAPLAGLSLAGAVLTHYSAAPYVLVVFGIVLWIKRRCWGNRPWQRSAGLALLAGCLALVTWFGWGLAEYGARFFTSNTTVTDQAPTVSQQLRVVALNLRDSIVPNFLGGADFTAFAQSSPWGLWRDWFFQLYQCNVWFMTGSVSGLILAACIWRYHRRKGIESHWMVIVPAVIVLGIAVHGGREAGGLAHICLQPLMLLGLAFLASQWAYVSIIEKRILVAGLTLDALAGIALQLSIESHLMDRWLLPNRPWWTLASTYSQSAQINARVKPDAGWIFVGDLAAPYSAGCIALLLGLLALALWLANRRPGSPGLLPSGPS